MTQVDVLHQAVTMKDVANRLGVSHTTISQVLRGVGRISQDRQQEILRVVQEMGYRPHVGAQLLRGKKTGQLGLILNQSLDIAMEGGFFGPVLGNFIRVCQENGQSYDIEVVPSDDDAQLFEPPRQLTGQLVDGTLVIGHVKPALTKWLNGQDRYPWVCMGEDAPYSINSMPDEGAYMAVQHLAALRHRRIVYIGGPLKYRNHQLGRDGFNRAILEFRLNQSHLDIHWAWEEDGTFSSETMGKTTDKIQAMLDLPQPPTAFICADMRIARLVIHIAISRGLKIPEDLSVIGAGPASHAQMGVPFLSAIEPDYPAMAEQAVLMLRLLVAGRRPGTPNQTVKPHLVMRDTVCPPAVKSNRDAYTRLKE